MTQTSTTLNSPQEMPTSDYTSAAGGGLRLKGVNPSSKITKHKKKKRPKPADPSSTDPTTEGPTSEKLPEAESDTFFKTPNSKSRLPENQDQNQDDREDETGQARGGKTEAELRHEERRRRRVCVSSSSSFPLCFLRILMY